MPYPLIQLKNLLITWFKIFIIVHVPGFELGFPCELGFQYASKPSKVMTIPWSKLT